VCSFWSSRSILASSCRRYPGAVTTGPTLPAQVALSFKPTDPDFEYDVDEVHVTGALLKVSTVQIKNVD
jgi:hypothetical protein